MYIPKRYGESKREVCPFCGQQATTVNGQKIPVCRMHTSSVLGEMRCICGKMLEAKTGKYGLYFSCSRCGNVTLKRALEVNPPNPRERATPGSTSKEVYVTPDDPRYFD